MASGDYGFSPSVFTYPQMDDDYTDTSQFLWDSPQPDTPAFQDLSESSASVKVEDTADEAKGALTGQKSSPAESKSHPHLDVPHNQASAPSSASETSSHSSSSDSSARRKRKASSTSSPMVNIRETAGMGGGSSAAFDDDKMFDNTDGGYQFDDSAFPSMGAGMGNLSLDAMGASGKQGFDFGVTSASPSRMAPGMFASANFQPAGFGAMRSAQPTTVSPEQTVQPSKTFFLGDSREDSPSSVTLMNSHESSPGAFFSSNSPLSGGGDFGVGGFTSNAGISAVDFESNSLGFSNGPSTGSQSVSPPSSGHQETTRWPCRLTVGATPEKSRVETQIPVKLTLHNVPSGATKLHLPGHTISKPKFQSKPAFEPSSDTLELSTMLVCASALQKDGLKERAFDRATSDEVPVRTEPAGNIDENDPARPLNGGPVTICQGCITRERKRAARKKTKKQEEEDEWAKDEAKRVIVFNCPEVRDWCVPDTKEIPVKDHNGPVESMFVNAPMRIACYCRHQGEKLGFQVIFTIKTSEGEVLAQAISDSIMITDDHKQPLGHSQQSSTSNQYQNASQQSAADSMLGQGVEGIYPTTFSQDMPFRTSWSTNDLRLLGNQYAPQRAPPNFQRQTSSNAQSQASTASATPRNLSRPASPTSPQGHSVKKRRSGGPGHVKMPSGLTMTRVENRSPTSNQVVRSSGPQSAGLPPSNFQFPTPTSIGMGSPIDQSFQTPTSMPQFQSGPTTPMTGIQGPSFSSGNFDSDYSFYSAPTSQHPSRPGSPSGSRMGMNPQIPQQAAYALESLPAGLNLNRPPIIQRLIPNTGSVRGGDEVTILGSGFIQGLEVMFGDRIAANTTYWGETTLVCRAPPSPREGSVSVVFKHQHRSAPHPLQQLTGLMPTVQVPYYYMDDEKPQMQGLGLAIASQQRMLDGNRINQEDMARQFMANPGGYGNFSVAGGGQGQMEQQDLACNAMDDYSFENCLLKWLEYLDTSDSPYRPAYDKRNGRGATLLSLAAGRGYNRLIGGLLARGANPDCRDRGGFNGMMMAALRGHSSTVRLLLRKGADPTLRSLCGYTAADLATSHELATTLWGLDSSASWNSNSRRVADEYRRPSSTPSLDSISCLSTSSQPSDPASLDDGGNDVAVMAEHEHPAMGLALAAFVAWRDQLLSQLHHLQQNMQWNIPTLQLPGIPPMPNLPALQPRLNMPDYQQYPVVRRISDLFTTATSPPAYEDIFPCPPTSERRAGQKACHAEGVFESIRDQKLESNDASGQSSSGTATPRASSLAALTKRRREWLPASVAEYLRTANRLFIPMVLLLIGLVVGFTSSDVSAAWADMLILKNVHVYGVVHSRGLAQAV